MENKEGTTSDIGNGKQVYAYEISRNGGINVTYVRADSLEEVKKMAEADLQARQSADPDPEVDYQLYGEPYESDEATMRIQESIDKKT
jgi:hypothetical protein